jgi:hypothetical protein
MLKSDDEGLVRLRERAAKQLPHGFGRNIATKTLMFVYIDRHE